MKKITSQRGSALLVAILVMGILLTLTLGLSQLTVREISQTANVISAGKAYYGAEAGIENALLDLAEHLPGYETAAKLGNEAGWVVLKPVSSDTSQKSDGLTYRYRIDNTADSYPYFDDNQPIFLQPDFAISKTQLYDIDNIYLDKTYNTLPLNGSVTIPLFVAGADGTSTDVTEFMIQYYVDFGAADPLDPLTIQYAEVLNKLQNFDILRWKLFGEPMESPGVTHAISDFYPAVNGSDSKNPVCIGTKEDLTDGVNCKFPVISVDYGSANDEDLLKKDNYLWSAARECYTNDAGVIVAGGDAEAGGTGSDTNKIGKVCLMKTFLGTHQKNYITLTNLVNPDIIGITNPAVSAKRANIYYRILGRVKDDNGQENGRALPRAQADIVSEGLSPDGRVKKSIRARLGLGNFLPVFNFSLYRTDTTE